MSFRNQLYPKYKQNRQCLGYKAVNISVYVGQDKAVVVIVGERDRNGVYHDTVTNYRPENGHFAPSYIKRCVLHFCHLHTVKCKGYTVYDELVIGAKPYHYQLSLREIQAYGCG